MARRRHLTNEDFRPYVPTPGQCIISNCDKPPFCKSAWCAEHSLGAKSQHRPCLWEGPLRCRCGGSGRWVNAS